MDSKGIHVNGMEVWAAPPGLVFISGNGRGHLVVPASEAPALCRAIMEAGNDGRVHVAPPFPTEKGMQFLAKDSDGQWFYVNHASTWQTCPPPVAPTPALAPLREALVSLATWHRENRSKAPLATRVIEAAEACGLLTEDKPQKGKLEVAEAAIRELERRVVFGEAPANRNHTDNLFREALEALVAVKEAK
jgi:hypothetical protein